MGFIGTFNHTMDLKGRVFVPKRFLGALTEGEPRHFIATRGLDGCVFMFTASQWKETAARVKGQAVGNPEARDFVRIFFADAEQIDIDDTGRVLMPERLRKPAQLERDVVFAGAHDRIELWDQTRWQRRREEIDKGYEGFARSIWT